MSLVVGSSLVARCCLRTAACLCRVVTIMVLEPFRVQPLTVVGQTSTDGDGGANLKRERKSLSIGESQICGLSIGESHTDKTRETFWDIRGWEL